MTTAHARRSLNEVPLNKSIKNRRNDKSVPTRIITDEMH
tara:strand:+ start:89 stop:205 length:117 start_codon:yes stop_codon:yes gene_type:complete